MAAKNNLTGGHRGEGKKVCKNLEEGDDAWELGGGKGESLQIVPHQELYVPRLTDLVHIQLSEP